MTETVKRNEQIDICRGLLILLVVIGHEVSMFSKHIYWFHMPAFFMLSGYLFKEHEKCYEHVKKTVKRYIIPYISYFIVLCIYMIFFRVWSVQYVLKNVVKERLLYASEWFPICLMFTIIFYNLLKKYVKRYEAIIIMLYILAHIESWFILKSGIEWICLFRIDIVMISMMYFWLGNKAKSISSKFSMNKRLVLIIVIFFCAFFIWGEWLGIINFEGINMKANMYIHMIWDFIIPAFFFLFIFLFSDLLRHTCIRTLFIILGSNSLSIMYLHMTLRHIIIYS